MPSLFRRWLERATIKAEQRASDYEGMLTPSDQQPQESTTFDALKRVMQRLETVEQDITDLRETQATSQNALQENSQQTKQLLGEAQERLTHLEEQLANHHPSTGSQRRDKGEEGCCDRGVNIVKGIRS